MLTLGSLFDGAGGFPFAAQQFGIKALWASEIEAFPIAVTSKRFPDMKHLGDVTKINGAEVEPVDIITFGSPCQDLSVAGRQEGLQGARSGLFMEAIRIIKEMREKTNGLYPRYAIWENVPGAFSSSKGEDFRSVLEAFCQVEESDAVIPRPPKGKWADAGEIVADGYSIAWRVLDAQYWGVPQRRRRIFLVADFRGGRAGEVLFEREGLSRHFAESREAWKGITKSLAFRPGNEGKSYCSQGNGIDRADTAGCNGRGWTEDVSYTLNTIDRPAVCAAFMAGQGAKAGNIAYNERLSPTLKSSLSGGNTVPSMLCFSVENHPQDCRVNIDYSGKDDGRTSFGIGEDGDPQFTISAAHEHGVFAVDCRNAAIAEDVNGKLQAKSTGGIGVNFQNVVLILQPVNIILRRLTPTECARLQGMPDWWCDDIPHGDSAEYKMWGNGMALPCVMYLMEGISKKEKEKEDGIQ